MPLDPSKALQELTFKDPPLFEFHVFICQNKRPEDSPVGSCFAKGSEALWQYMKARVGELKCGNIRINKSGCLGQCAHGPVLVIYPQAKWFQVKTPQDIETILEEYILPKIASLT